MTRFLILDLALGAGFWLILVARPLRAKGAGPAFLAFTCLIIMLTWPILLPLNAVFVTRRRLRDGTWVLPVPMKAATA